VTGAAKARIVIRPTRTGPGSPLETMKPRLSRGFFLVKGDVSKEGATGCPAGGGLAYGLSSALRGCELGIPRDMLLHGPGACKHDATGRAPVPRDLAIHAVSKKTMGYSKSNL
jgi:hypothetical protein